jgi:hypothetical protein
MTEGFDQPHASAYLSRLLGALPTTIVAPPGSAWQSALVGPARYSAGYRDAVILAQGRLYRGCVRQRRRDGNLHANAAKEIDRVIAAVRAGVPTRIVSADR